MSSLNCINSESVVLLNFIVVELTTIDQCVTCRLCSIARRDVVASWCCVVVTRRHVGKRGTSAGSMPQNHLRGQAILVNLQYQYVCHCTCRDQPQYARYAIGASSSEMHLPAHSTESCEEPRTQLVLSCLTKVNIGSHSLDIAMTIAPHEQ